MFWKSNLRAEQKYLKCSRTGFQNGLVDFNFSSDWLLVVQVRNVIEGFRAGWTGVTVGHAFTRTGCPPCVDFKHSDQLEDIQNNCRVLNTRGKKMNILKSSRFPQDKHNRLENGIFRFINNHEPGYMAQLLYFIIPVELHPASFCHLCTSRREKKWILSEALLSHNFFSEQKLRRAGRQRCREHAQHGEVCSYEISSQMRSDKRMRSCQTQWHGCRNEMRPDTWAGDGGQRDDKQF